MTRASLRMLLEIAWLRRASSWLSYALSLTRNRDDADDLVSESVARTLRAAPDLGSELEVHKYLLRAIRNNWLTWDRNRKNRRELYRRLKEHLPTATPSPLRAFIDAEEESRLNGIVAEALAGMKMKIRGAAELYLIGEREKTLREVAAIEDVSVATVQRRVREALRILRAALQGEDDS